MVFKRRDARSWGRTLAEAFWPRGGWGRAITYLKHRLRRLPGTPEQIGRGIFAGAVTVFTPFYGLHFIVAAVFARVLRGNMLAALLATFLGNPLTYIPISIISLRLGHWLLGTPPEFRTTRNVFDRFGEAAGDLWHNFVAMFTPAQAHWDGLIVFWQTVFYPWLVGGIVPGLIAGLVCYIVSVPVIRAYQKSRLARLKKRMGKLRDQAGAAPQDG
ncbi:DUF2062 domain-containing protein [Rhodobacterales bacterium HKCCE2091]|nr:DUF2062 domain-containing protein [Rhodobacterales bacterium HKCCE2091]